jgi:radical SAM family uncharacterized protein/radical SAM-linked protein
MIDHPYADFLSNVERPGRYIGGEFGAATPEQDADVRMVLSYPDTYEIGMSHIGLGVLYEIVNARFGMSLERVFMPWGDLEKELLSKDLPLVSLESARPIRDFDVLGFSLQYELTYTNLVAMLSLGRIPRRALLRTEEDPIVIAGGPLAAHCEPIAPFLDLVFLGDGEEALVQFLECLRRLKNEGKSRAEKIRALAELPFVFAPNAHERTRDERSGRLVVGDGKEPLGAWSKVANLSDHAPGGGISPNVETVFDRFSLEISRGCQGGCRFCQAGFLYRPVRERTVEDARAAVERAVSCIGFDGVSLASLSTADHSSIGPMLFTLGEEYTPRRVSFFVPSLRAYGLSDEMVEVLSRLRATGVTLAPEAGSARLRDVINKNITEEDLLVAASRFFDWGIMRIKLYFMLGLPTETDEDLLDIIRLAARVRDFGRRRMHGRTPTVTVSVSTFVPKPFTPFALEAMIDKTEIRRRQALLLDAGRALRLEVRTHAEGLSVLEGVLCRGDASLAEAIERAVDLGARFDGWSDRYRPDVWEAALKDVDVPRLLAAIPYGARVPWDHVSAGVDESYLREELSRARQGVLTEPCGRFADGDGDRFVCGHCGAACKRGELPIRMPRIAQDVSALKPPAPKPKGFPRPRAVEDAGAKKPVRIVLFMAKWGRQSFVGHLDTMRIVMRSLRRAGLELFYTQGFNPKPKMSSGPPLPLGISAMKDPIEVFLVDPPDDDTLMKRLSSACPEDFAFVGIERLPEGHKGLGRRIEAARYIAQLQCDRASAQDGVQRLMSASAIEVIREKDGKKQTVDIRPYIIGAEVLDRAPDGLLPPLAPNRVLYSRVRRRETHGNRPRDLS